MAKVEKEPAEQQKRLFSFDDFAADAGVAYSPDEEEIEEDEDELEEEKPKKAVKKVKVKAELEEEDEDLDEDEEKPKPKKKEEKKKPVVEIQEEEQEDQASEEEQEEDQADPLKFFEEVEKITGYEVDVDYGGVDPISPQGVAIREKAVRESTVAGFLEEIEANHPAVYKALLHANNGGDISELFSTSAQRDYAKVQIGEKDEALATEILKDFYKARGVKSESKILKMIETDQDSELGLIGEAKNALKDLQEEQANKANEIFESQKAKKAEQEKRDRILITSVDEILETGKIGDIKLQDRKESIEFRKFLLQNVRKNGEKYDFITPIEAGSLDKLLQYQYFQFKKGDLSKLIQIKATTQNANNLKLRLQSEQSRIKAGTGAKTTDVNKKMSFDDFTN